MEKIGYIIFKYEEGKFTAPEFFADEKAAYNRYDELVAVLKSNCDEVDENDEINGKEISLIPQDTIYRIATAEYNDECDKLHVYCDMENDKYFQIGHYMVSEDHNEVLTQYNEQVSKYRELSSEDDKGCYANVVCVYDTDNLKSTEFSTENGKYGDAYFGCMIYSLSMG